MHWFRYTGFVSRRLEGYRLLTYAALAGAALAPLGRIAAALGSHIPWVGSVWHILGPPNIPYLGTAFASFAIGASAPFLLNLAIERTGFRTIPQIRLAAINRFGNQLLVLLHTAQTEEKLVALTLDNRKVYIGVVSAAPNLEPHDGFISIVPFLSGYRETAGLKLVLSVDYVSLYASKQAQPSDLRVVIPISSVRMASLFDPDIHEKFEIIDDILSRAPIAL